MNITNPKIVFFGTGAIGGSVGAWIAENYDNVWLYDRKETADIIRVNGISTYCGGEKSTATTVRAKVLDDINGLSDADVIAVCVKNYSLGEACSQIKNICGDRPVIIGMQNGAENLKIMPEYFTKVIYCVIGYNAWIDSPGVVGYQKKGPLVLGTTRSGLEAETAAIAAIWNRGVETVVSDRIRDAIHTKIVINLANSLTTLIGLGFREITDYPMFQKILTNMTGEGVRIVKAAGYLEYKIGGMPPWFLLRAMSVLPGFITGRIFRKNVRKMVISSMAQDIIARGGHTSELDTINGYMLSLADKHGVSAPYNRAVYEMCRREFAREKFTPLSIEDVGAEVLRRVQAG